MLLDEKTATITLKTSAETNTIYKTMSIYLYIYLYL